MKPHLKTIASLAVALASLTSLAAAQKDHRFGIQGGVVFAKLGGAGTKDPEVGTLSNRTGFLAGIFAELQLSSNFAISPEANYVVKGVKLAQSGGTGNIKISYVQVPLLFKVLVPVKSTGKTEIRPQFYAGPAIGFRAGCDFTASFGTQTESNDCSKPDPDLAVKSTDISIIVGAGLGVGPVFFGARYDLGLTDIQTATGHTSEHALKNRALSLLVGVSFPMHKQ
jgi:hypothetical protein